ncbi:hypothetical protein KEM48_009594 [Puccinia striiformis f. sp. tritici PST-130]|nr:hypothetical protein KEM48_009594 [Puccinia striiformis f. sp. tritici PST-130]
MKFSTIEPPAIPVVPQQSTSTATLPIPSYSAHTITPINPTVRPSDRLPPPPLSEGLTQPIGRPSSPSARTSKPASSHWSYVRHDHRLSHPYYRPSLPPRPHSPVGDSLASPFRRIPERHERPRQVSPPRPRFPSPPNVSSAPLRPRSPLMSLPSPPRNMATPPRRMSSPLKMWPSPAPPPIARKWVPPASTEQQLLTRPAPPADMSRPEKPHSPQPCQSPNVQLKESRQNQFEEADSPDTRCSSRMSLDSDFRDPSPAESNSTSPTAPQSPVDHLTSKALTEADRPFTASFSQTTDTSSVSMDLDSSEFDELKSELDELKHDTVNLPDPQPETAMNPKQHHQANIHAEIAFPHSLVDTMSSSDLDAHIPWSDYDESDNGVHVPWSDCDDESEREEAEMTNKVPSAQATEVPEQNEKDELEQVGQTEIRNCPESRSNDDSHEILSTGLNESLKGEPVSDEDDELDGKPLLSDNWWASELGTKDPYQTLSIDSNHPIGSDGDHFWTQMVAQNKLSSH